MGRLQSFISGFGVSFAVCFLTKRRPDGQSILDNILDKPKAFAEQAKDYALEEVVQTVKKELK